MEELIKFLIKQGYSPEEAETISKKFIRLRQAYILQAPPEWEHDPYVISAEQQKRNEKLLLNKRKLADVMTFGMTPHKNEAAQIAGAEDLTKNIVGTLALEGLNAGILTALGHTNLGRSLALSYYLNKNIPDFRGLPINPIVKAITTRPKITSKNTLSALDFIEYMSNAEFRDLYNTFARKYGYEEMPIGLSREQMNQLALHVIERHNLFMRGVEPIASLSKLNLVTTALGHVPSEEELMLYAATHTYPGYKGVWVSPSSNASIYGGNGKVALVRRPYTLGSDRRNWFNEGDFRIGLALGPSERVVDPWGSGFEKSIPTELKIDKPEFVRWLSEEEALNPITSLNSALRSNNIIRKNSRWYIKDINGNLLEIPEKVELNIETMFTASEADWNEAMNRALAANNEVEMERLNYLHNYVITKPEIQEIKILALLKKNEILSKLKNKSITWHDIIPNKLGITNETPIEQAELWLDEYLNKVINRKGAQMFLNDFNSGRITYDFAKGGIIKRRCKK